MDENRILEIFSDKFKYAVQTKARTRRRQRTIRRRHRYGKSRSTHCSLCLYIFMREESIIIAQTPDNLDSPSTFSTESQKKRLAAKEVVDVRRSFSVHAASAELSWAAHIFPDNTICRLGGFWLVGYDTRDTIDYGTACLHCVSRIATIWRHFKGLH